MFIIVGCLLLVIGVSLAYFFATSLINGDGASTSGTTAVIHGATLTMEGTLNFDDKDILPGHKNVSVLKLTATGNNEMIPYNVIWTGTNGLGTPLKFTVYKSTTEISTGKTCNQVAAKVNGVNTISEECTITNEASMGSAIASGIISTSTTETKIMLVEGEMITATPSGEVLYYYVVLEYPNLDSDQSDDMGGSFSGIVSVEEGDAIPDINIVGIYTKAKDASTYTKTDTIPSKDSKYKFNSGQSSCTNSAIPSWNEETWDVTVSNLTSTGTDCNLYFEEQAGTPASEIIAEAGNSTDDSMFAGITGDGVYTWTKGDYSGGTQPIKYFRGNVNNNWVVFGKDGSNYIWWRIIRTNSNGSLRMIYAGLSSSKTSAPATTGTGTQIGASVFNSSYNSNVYVGFKYTYDQVHGTKTNSTILGQLDSWYNRTLAKSANYSSKIDVDAGFCNDRTPHSGTGLRQAHTQYAAYSRLVNNKTPSLSCTNADDIFKTSVGLITADEVSMGGIGFNSALKNVSSYLYTNGYYWTMSPYDYNPTVSYPANVFVVFGSGYLYCHRVNATDNGVRPVINLKSNTLFEEGGTGLANNPYIVQGA